MTKDKKISKDLKIHAHQEKAAPNEDSLKPVSDSEERSLAHWDPLQFYLFEIRRYGLLTREEEVELAIRVQENDDEVAAHRLITSNLRLVVKIAMDLHRYWTKNLMDLIQEGNLGLLKAVTRFDPYRGIKFSYYASFWIKAYILKSIMDNWKLVRIGTTQAQRKLFFNLSKERERLLAQGFDPHPGLLAERLSVKEEEVVEMTQRLGEWEVSLNTPVMGESNEQYEVLLPDPGRDADEQLAQKEGERLLNNKLKEFRKTLSKRDIDIFDNRILAEKPETLKELGERHHVSRERIRQLQQNIVTNVEAWLTKEIPNFREEYSNFSN